MTKIKYWLSPDLDGLLDDFLMVHLLVASVLEHGNGSTDAD